MNSLDSKETIGQRRRAKMAEIRQRYPGLHRAITMNTSMHPNCRCMSMDLADDAKVTPISWSLYGNVIQKTPRTFDYPFGPMPPLPASTAINLSELLASGQARRINDHAVEIVTPGYHNDPQGDSMLSEKCSDPYCNVCRPQTATSSNVSLGSMPSWQPSGSVVMSFDLAREALAEEIANAFKLSPQDLGLPKQKQGATMSPVAQRVIADLQSLDEKDYSAISDEINRIQRGKKNAIEEDLDGVARMTLRDKSMPKLRPFVLSYFKDGKTSTVQGVELGNSCVFPEGEETKEYRVFIFSRDFPVAGTFYTMKTLDKALESNGIPYTYIYASKA